VSVRGRASFEALFDCGVRWEASDPEKLTRMRRSLLKVGDYDLRAILSRLRRPEVGAPETYQELVRTPRMQERVLALGLVKRPVGERERQRDQFARLMERYDGAAPYERSGRNPSRRWPSLTGSPMLGWGKSAASCA
jgi:hypothetical protein